MFNANYSIRIQSIVSLRGTKKRTTNADSSLRRRRRSEFREFQDRHSNHCGEADEHTSGNYGQTAILSDGGVHVRLYLHTCTRAPNCHYIVGNGGQIRCRGRRRRGRKGRDLERQERWGKRIRVVCERSVGEMDEGDTTERTRETRESKEGGSSPRERERPLENYKLYVVPNRPSKIIPAHPAAIMNM